MPNSKRLQYFDILKGMAIFMVVMGHVLTMCVRNIDSATIFKFIGQIHMPLFFFISGWFTFKLLDNGKVRIPNLRQRAIQLLVPMVVMSTLWFFYYPNSGLQSPMDSTFNGMWTNLWKNGYWFTLVLFEIILIYSAIAPVFGRMKTLGSQLVLTAAVWCLLGVLQFCILPQTVVDYMSSYLVVKFFPVFMTGAIAARNRETFNRMTASGPVLTTALVAGSFLLYFSCWWWNFSLKEGTLLEILLMIAGALFHGCLAIVAIGVVKPWSENIYAEPVRCPSMVSGQFWGNIWQLLGRKSLAIYLLHYFFLFPLGFCRETLISMNLGFVPLFVFSAAIAAAIVAVVLFVDTIISASPALALLMTGTVKKKK